MSFQEAMHTESLEGQVDDPGEDHTEPDENITTRQVSLSTLRSPACSPRPASVRTRKHTFGQRCISSRPPTLGGDEAEAADPADEKVSHITSSAHPWPATEPHSPEASPTASPAKGALGSGRNPRRFCSVDAQSFLDTPGRGDTQRWPSVELDSGDSHLESGEGRGRASELEPALGARRKKKMSPPCISIEPPAEDEGSSRPPPTEGGNTTLRRRTPSCEATLHRDCPESIEGPGTGGDPVAKGERWGQASCREEPLLSPTLPLNLWTWGDLVETLSWTMTKV
ncbi:voltage-dependent T-type calcium channel subunit alpha-1H isoform X1 [Sigmodon hispidus]